MESRGRGVEIAPPPGLYQGVAPSPRSSAAAPLEFHPSLPYDPFQQMAWWRAIEASMATAAAAAPGLPAPFSPPPLPPLPPPPRAIDAAALLRRQGASLGASLGGAPNEGWDSMARPVGGLGWAVGGAGADSTPSAEPPHAPGAEPLAFVRAGTRWG